MPFIFYFSEKQSSLLLVRIHSLDIRNETCVWMPFEASEKRYLLASRSKTLLSNVLLIDETTTMRRTTYRCLLPYLTLPYLTVLPCSTRKSLAALPQGNVHLHNIVSVCAYSVWRGEARHEGSLSTLALIGQRAAGACNTRRRVFTRWC